MTYKNKLTQISQKAADELTAWIDSHGGVGEANRDDLISYAYALTAKYGEASGAYTAQYYDDMARLSNVTVPAAEVAELPSYGEVAKAINGTIKKSSKSSYVGSTSGRLVKQVSADTLQKNALRDGAEWAWIPAGDTCVFCLTLASRGWQRASKKALKNGHAEHIHANCDCTYAVRFDSNTTVEGYEPGKYLEMYENAEGDTPQEKINSMRRIQYQNNREKILEQKRGNYAEKKTNVVREKERLHTSYTNKVQLNALDAPGYIEKYQGITEKEEVNNSIYECANEILKHRNGTNFEDLYLIDANTGDVIHKLTTCNLINEVKYDDETKAKIAEAHEEGRRIIAIHNHPGGLPPSMDDGVSAYNNKYDIGVVVGHNLEVYTYSATDGDYSEEQCREVHNVISDSVQFSVDFEDEIWYTALKKFGMEVVRK